MFRKLPVIGHPIVLGDLFSALFRGNAKSEFTLALKSFFNAPYVF